ncbi:MAG: hypothetical protein ACTSUB_05930, partial [Candidatus Thorarchaeota archaeon]
SVYSLFVLLSLPFAIVGIRKTLKHYDNSIPMIPANVSTIMNHLVTGLLLTAAYIVHGLVEQLSYPIVEVVILSTIILVLLVIYFYRKVPKMD